jgi:phosphocarrier protein
MGIHLRPASSLVQLCNQYPACEVEISKNGLSVNGKSIMSVIMLAAEKGSQLTIKVSGEECQSLLTDLVSLIESKFGEEE